MDGTSKVIRSSFSIISMFSRLEHIWTNVAHIFDETLGHDSEAARARYFLGGFFLRSRNSITYVEGNTPDDTVVATAAVCQGFPNGFK